MGEMSEHRHHLPAQRPPGNEIPGYTNKVLRTASTESGGLCSCKPGIHSRASVQARISVISVIALLLAGCPVARPARFFDAPPVQDVHDDGPIPIPQRLDPIKETLLSEAYVERPMVMALDPKRAPEAGDVNALDEVPRSTWLSVDDAKGAADDEPPAPPFRLLEVEGVTREEALAVMDARGRRFEVWRDPPDRPEMATSAAVVASRLLRVLGYFTPGVWATDVERGDFVVRDKADNDALLGLFHAGPRAFAGRFRVAITRWPIGADLGPMPVNGTRSDDPNDRVSHEDRRSLRALKLIFGWLGMTDAGREVLRDAYVGAPGRGHVVHYVAGLGGALGADAVVRALPLRDDDTDLSSRNVWITLATLGLYQQKPELTSDRWPAIGEYRSAWPVADFHTSPPSVAMDRAGPPDLYWAAKHIAGVDRDTITRALDAANYHDATAKKLLGELIAERQRLAVRWGFSLVTPCEVDRIEQPRSGARAVLVLRDEAIALGINQAATTVYRVEALDDAGKPVAEPFKLGISGGSLIAVRLPERLPPYLVMRVTTVRKGDKSPRAMEVHVRSGGTVRVVGVVH